MLYSCVFWCCSCCHLDHMPSCHEISVLLFQLLQILSIQQAVLLWRIQLGSVCLGPQVCGACPGNGKRTGNPSQAENFKAKANEAFKSGDFDGAIAGYSGAIQADPYNPVYFSNRAMAYLKVCLCVHDSLCCVCDKQIFCIDECRCLCSIAPAVKSLHFNEGLL